MGTLNVLPNRKEKESVVDAGWRLTTCRKEPRNRRGEPEEKGQTVNGVRRGSHYHKSLFCYSSFLLQASKVPLHHHLLSIITSGCIIIQTCAPFMLQKPCFVFALHRAMISRSVSYLTATNTARDLTSSVHNQLRINLCESFEQGGEQVDAVLNIVRPCGFTDGVHRKDGTTDVDGSQPEL